MYLVAYLDLARAVPVVRHLPSLFGMTSIPSESKKFLCLLIKRNSPKKES